MEINNLITGTSRDTLVTGSIHGGVQILEYAGYSIYECNKKYGNHTLVHKKQHF